MLYLNYKIVLKLFFPSLPDVIFRQLDNEYENDRQGQITSVETRGICCEHTKQILFYEHELKHKLQMIKINSRQSS